MHSHPQGIEAQSKCIHCIVPNMLQIGSFVVPLFKCHQWRWGTVSVTKVPVFVLTILMSQSSFLDETSPGLFCKCPNAFNILKGHLWLWKNVLILYWSLVLKLTDEIWNAWPKMVNKCVYSQAWRWRTSWKIVSRQSQGPGQAFPKLAS